MTRSEFIALLFIPFLAFLSGCVGKEGARVIATKAGSTTITLPGAIEGQESKVFYNGIEIIPDDDPRRGTHYFLPSEGIDYDKISAMVRDKYLPEMVDLICGGLPK